MTDTESTQPAPRRVVVAEDESLIRLDIVEILRDNGFEVVGEAGDGETAVALATELRPDLVIMDVKMPQLDGISAAERLSKGHIAPVVLLTAFSQKELVERASEAGALAYVVKPFTPNDLLPAIEIALARYAQIIALEAEVGDLVERFETRKLVDRAKGLLNEKMGLTEPEAFRWIQKASMDRRLTMKDVSQAIIEQLARQEVAPTRSPHSGCRGDTCRRGIRCLVPPQAAGRSLMRFVMRIVEHPTALIVGDGDLVRREGAAEVDRRADAGDPAARRRARVGRVDLDADGEPAGARPEVRGHGAERLAEHHVGAAVQQHRRLGVALDRHSRDRSLDRELEELDAHLLGQGAGSAGVEARVDRTSLGSGSCSPSMAAPVGRMSVGRL